MKSLIFGLVLLATLLNPSRGACTDNDGVPIPSVLQIPTFEGSVAEVQTTLNTTLSTASEALASLMSLSSDWTVQQARSGYPLTFGNTLGALEDLQNTFWRPGYRLHLLSRVSDKEEVRTEARAAVLEFQAWQRENVYYNEELYLILKEYGNTEEAAELTGERRLLLNDTLEAYQRRGMALSQEDRDQLQAWQEELTELTSNITTSINLATGAVEFTLDELEGLSDQQLQALQYNETEDTYTAFTAIRSQYQAVTTYAANNETRLKAITARMQRTMEENGEPILAVLNLRNQIASLLGYAHWADYKTADKMAKDGATALDFITNIDERLEDQFAKEQEILLATKRDHLNDTDVNAFNRHDISFYKNILLERDYQINQEEVSEYFEEEATLKGIFELYEELFNITIVYDPEASGISAEDGQAWAEDVKFVYIFEKGGLEPLGGVYLDLHPRDGKYKHFAKFSIINGHQKTSGVDGNLVYQAPVCAIIGNWPVAVGNVSVSLWRFGNVNTMLHEFGHALHTVLTCAEFTAYAGTAVPRDFVEVPSQMLERWLDDINVVRRFAKHYETGQPMPEHLLQSLIDARMFMVGHAYRGQVAYGLADLNIHTYSDPDEIPKTPEELYVASNQDYSRYYPVPEDTATLASFGHLFGGYDAGYYGYAWADAIAADLASLFRASPDGFMDTKLGDKFRREILEPGGSRDPTESIRAFLGRDWNTDAFFAEMGLEDSLFEVAGEGDESVEAPAGSSGLGADEEGAVVPTIPGEEDDFDGVPAASDVNEIDEGLAGVPDPNDQDVLSGGPAVVVDQDIDEDESSASFAVGQGLLFGCGTALMMVLVHVF